MWPMTPKCILKDGELTELLNSIKALTHLSHIFVDRLAQYGVCRHYGVECCRVHRLVSVANLLPDDIECLCRGRLANADAIHLYLAA